LEQQSLKFEGGQTSRFKFQGSPWNKIDGVSPWTTHPYLIALFIQRLKARAKTLENIRQRNVLVSYKFATI
jgi:hypothetical protein